jgi:hypothetical protein
MLMEHIMKEKGTYIALAAFTCLSAFAGYARIWEYRQPTREIKNAIVTDIKDYYRKSEIHWSTSENRIHINVEEKVIDFPSGRWDNTVKIGDSVDLMVRESFPLFGKELDGRVIEDYK